MWLITEATTTKPTETRTLKLWNKVKPFNIWLLFFSYRMKYTNPQNQKTKTKQNKKTKYLPKAQAGFKKNQTYYIQIAESHRLREYLKAFRKKVTSYTEEQKNYSRFIRYNPSQEAMEWNF